VAAVDSCLMSTFLFFAEKSGIKVHSYGSTTAGRMDKTPQGLRFTGMDVNITAVVDENTDVDKARRLQSKLEKYCPVSTSLRCPVILYLKVTVREDHKDG
jgi:organic hydroperoxide reductase OsmC/OhrA